MLLAGYVRNQATTEADIEAAVRTSGLDPSAWMASYAGMLRRLADPQRFPALTEFIAAGVFDAADGPDDEFIFGLDRILDGIEVLIQALPARSPVKAPTWPVRSPGRRPVARPSASASRARGTDGRRIGGGGIGGRGTGGRGGGHRGDGSRMGRRWLR